MIRQYSSFAEIDEQLRILRLKREIDSESIKLHLNQAKVGLYPSNLLGRFKVMVQKTVLTSAIKTLSRFSGKLHSIGSGRWDQIEIE